jgi:hypothetical protein
MEMQRILDRAVDPSNHHRGRFTAPFSRSGMAARIAAFRCWVGAGPGGVMRMYGMYGVGYDMVV